MFLILALGLIFSVVEGAEFPPLSGKTLDGEAVVIPSPDHSQPTLLVMGFSYGTRHEMEAWARTIREEIKIPNGVRYFEVAMLGRGMAAKLLKPIALAFMKGKAPESEYPRILVVFTDNRPYHAAFGIDEDRCCIGLISQSGDLEWSHAGPVTEEAKKSIRERLNVYKSGA